MSRALEHPVGWPMAMAPPFGFTRAMSGWNSLSQASTTEAKASLISTRSMSSRESFALASTNSVAGIGAVSMIWGSLAATAKVWKRARGRRPSDDARSSLMISTAAAPSEICDDVPAVTVPVSEKAGFNPANFSSEVSRRMPSSDSSSPLTAPAPGTSGWTRASSGTISLAKRPSSVARAARRCDSRANSSICWRETFQRRAISSAHSPWWISSKRSRYSGP